MEQQHEDVEELWRRHNEEARAWKEQHHDKKEIVERDASFGTTASEMEREMVEISGRRSSLEKNGNWNRKKNGACRMGN